MTIYKQALLLHKLYNNETKNIGWTNLFFNQQFNARQIHLIFLTHLDTKLAMKILLNRFAMLNDNIKHIWQNKMEEYVYSLNSCLMIKYKIL